MNLQHIQSFFEHLAVDAAKRYVRSENITNELKDDGTPVTKIDKGINAYVIEKIEKAFPGIPILSEEFKDRGDRLNSQYCFVVDPIDGTAALKESKGISDLEEFVKFVDANDFTLGRINSDQVSDAGYSIDGVRALLLSRKFHNGNEVAAMKEFSERIREYSVLLGLAKYGRSVSGVCYMPATGELYSASEGNGAVKIVDGSREIIQTSGEDENRIVIGRYNIDEDLIRILAQEGRSLRDVQFGGSFGVKVCWVAEGRFDKYIHTNLDPNKKVHASLWDSCAVDVILSEAGGSSFDLKRKPIDYKSTSVPLTQGYIAIGKK